MPVYATTATYMNPHDPDRIVVFSNVYGNGLSLKAVLPIAKRLEADQIISLGDAVGYGPNPGECLALLSTTEITRVVGDLDLAVAGEHTAVYPKTAAMEWTRAQLDEYDMECLANQAPEYRDDSCTYTHGNPLAPFQFLSFIFDEDYAKIFTSGKERIFFVGHHLAPSLVRYHNKTGDLDICTRQQGLFHSPFPIRDAYLYLINVGAISNPLGGGEAYFVLFDKKGEYLRFIKVPLWAQLAEMRVQPIGLPTITDQQLDELLEELPFFMPAIANEEPEDEW